MVVLCGLYVCGNIIIIVGFIVVVVKDVLSGDWVFEVGEKCIWEFI